MNNLDKQYQSLLQDILDNGVEKEDRTGTGTHSVFGRQIRHKMSEGFPALTTKRLAFKTMTTELLWFLRGDTNIKYLVDNGCNIWNGDCYKKFKESFSPMPGIQSSIPLQDEFIEKIKNQEGFADIWGELGPIYGKQWRRWTKLDYHYGNTSGDLSIDQIQNLINDLKTNPDSRRLMVNAWNVSELDQMGLPPCHYGFQLYSTELSPMEVLAQAKKDGLWDDGSGFDGYDRFGKNSDGELFHEWLGRVQSKFKTRSLSLMWNQRSVDTFLGLPFNIASYGLLLELIAKEVNMVPDELIGNLGDTHLYKNHIEQAKEQIGRDSFELPKLIINNEFWNPDDSMLSVEQVKHMELSDFILDGYESHPSIKAPLSN